jgi:hypothetical protein
MALNDIDFLGEHDITRVNGDERLNTVTKGGQL